jgi:hypothetical protein
MQKSMPMRVMLTNSIPGVPFARVPLAPSPNSTPGYVVAPHRGAVLYGFAAQL